MKERLFHDSRPNHLIRDEFERFLPVYLKTQRNQGEKFDSRSAAHTIFNLLGPVGKRHLRFVFCHFKLIVLVTCKKVLLVKLLEKYGMGDGEKRVCGLQQLQAMNSLDGTNNSECVVYSIGSRNEWSFETSIVEKTHCRVETFDCTLAASVTGPPAALQSRVRLHKVCLGSSDYTLKDGKQFLSWPSLHKLTGLTHSPTYLKMDIEGYEFPVMLSIINSGQQLPLQIAMELHTIRMEKGQYVRDYTVDTGEFYAFVHFLYKFGGYYLVDRNDDNNQCTCCSEILLAKLHCENWPANEEYRQALTDPMIQPKGFAKTMSSSMDATYYV
jgi:hypothetical protein